MAEFELPRTWGGKLKTAIMAINDELETVGSSTPSTPADYRDEHYIIAAGGELEGSGQISIDPEDMSGPEDVDAVIVINQDGCIEVTRAGLYAVCLSGTVVDLTETGGNARLSLQPLDESFFYVQHDFPLTAENSYEAYTLGMLTAMGIDNPGAGGWLTGSEGWKQWLTKHIALQEGEVLALFGTSGIEPPVTVTFDYEIDIYPILFISEPT